MTPALSSVPTLASLGPKSIKEPGVDHKPQTNHKEQTQMFKNFLMDESGAELVEYAAAAALLVAVALVIYQVLGQGISDANSQTGKDIQNASITVNP